MGQQQGTALCDISAQVQQYQQFLGEQHLHSARCSAFILTIHSLLNEFETSVSPAHVTEDIILCSLCISVYVEASRPLPDFVDVDLQDRTLPDGILIEHLKAFQTLYREHCEVGSHGHTVIVIDFVRCPCTQLHSVVAVNT